MLDLVSIFNAFDMKYDKKNDKDIYDYTNEGILATRGGNYIKPSNYALYSVDRRMQ